METHMKAIWPTWQFWAVASAVFAALTAIFAKLGVQDVSSDFATFIPNPCRCFDAACHPGYQWQLAEPC